MSASPDTLAIDPEESRVLEEENIFQSKSIHGKRKVSAALLSPPYSQGSQSSSSSGSSASIHIRPFNPSTKEPFDLPESADSVAALEFIGYTRVVAGEIFERWITRGHPNPDGLLCYALAKVNELGMPKLRHLSDRAAMTGLGISNELQESLTDPQFSQIFRSETLSFWLKDTMKIRYVTLEMLLQRLKSYAGETIAKRKGHKRPKIAGVFEPDALSSQQPSFVASSNIESGEDILPRAHISIQEAPPIRPDHYILYKGKANDLYMDPTEGFINDSGTMQTRFLQTMPGGDFNSTEVAYYWMKEKSTAEIYRQWGIKRSEYSESWIIQIQVPKNFIDSLRKEQLWFSRDWKEYVWNCRKGCNDMPEKFDKLWKTGRAQLVEGHICARAPNIIPRIPKDKFQERITESDVLYTEGEKATQSVFMNTDTFSQLLNLIRGKVHIEIYPSKKVAD